MSKRYTPCLNCGDTKRRRTDPRNKHCNKDCYTQTQKGIVPWHATRKAMAANKGRPLSEKCKRKISQKHFIHGLDNKGYRRLGRDKGRMFEHIYVAQKMIGRKLRKDEIVHHKDRNRLNNSPENLQVMTRSEHSKLHIKDAVRGGGKNKGGITAYVQT